MATEKSVEKAERKPRGPSMPKPIYIVYSLDVGDDGTVNGIVIQKATRKSEEVLEIALSGSGELMVARTMLA